jgi:hypothetical protein
MEYISPSTGAPVPNPGKINNMSPSKIPSTGKRRLSEPTLGQFENENSQFNSDSAQTTEMNPNLIFEVENS